MGRGPLAGDGVAGRVLIPRRFNGPPASANGGYACGLIARYVGGPAEVSLRSPPPLDTALELVRTTDGELRLCIASCSWPRAGPPIRRTSSRPCGRPWRRRARRCAGIRGGSGRHPFNDCYVCGAADTTASACTSATCAGIRR